MSYILRKVENYIEIRNTVDGSYSKIPGTSVVISEDGTNITFDIEGYNYDIVIPYSQITSPVTANITALVQGLRDWANPLPVILPNSKPFDVDDRLYNNSDVLEFEGVPVGGGGGGNVDNGTTEGSTLRWNDTSQTWEENTAFLWENVANYFGGLTASFLPGITLNGNIYIDAGVENLFAGIQDNFGQMQSVLAWNGATADDNGFVGVIDDGRVLLASSTASGYQGGLIFNPSTESSVWQLAKQGEDVQLAIELNKADDKIFINLNDDGIGNYTNGIEIATSAIGLNYRGESALTFSQNQVLLESDNPIVLSRLRFNNQNIAGGGVELYWGNVVADQDEFDFRYSNDNKTYSILLQDNISTGFSGFTNIDINNGEIISNISTKDGVSGTNQKSELYLEPTSAQLNYENQQGGNDYITRFVAGVDAQMSFADNNSGDNSLVVVGTNYTGDNSVNLVAVNNSNQCSISVSNGNIVIITQDGTDQLTITVRGSKNAGGAMLNITGDIPNYADNTAAVAAGCVPGDIYRSNNNSLSVVV